MTPPTTHDAPLELANECTVEDIRRWLTAWGEQVDARQMAVPESALKHVRALLDGLWESDEPEPTPHELVALLSLTQMMGETEAAHDASLQILLPLLSLPEFLRRHIEVNVATGSYRFVGKLRVINRIGVG